MSLEGEFPAPDQGMANVSPDRVLWNEAFITLGITDLKGIRDTVNFSTGQASLTSEPGVLTTDVVESGITCKTPMITPAARTPFSLAVNLNGSSELRVTPVGQVTHVEMESPWQNPSFVGNFLPESRDISGHGFQAQWRVLNMNRNFPQVWPGNKYKVAESSFGVRLFLPVDEYQKTSRTVKYAILFIGLTFVSFFLSEVIAKVTLHPVQYALIGFALVIFYVLLLSISEHTSFNLAYAVSSVSIIGLVALYAKWITGDRKIAVIITCILTLLYAFLFVTLQLEDFALLLGSVGLFVILGLVMYLTRTVDWFALGGQKATSA
jgi:inner membrane protein